MSLLVPTVNDYDDAHGDLEEEVIYRQKYSEIENSKDSEGNYVLPWKYEVVPGFFKQASDDTDDSTFNHRLEHFGRIKSWKDTVSEIDELNKNAGPNESYKLVFFARHGQGYHNVCVEKYGLEEWNRKWHAMSTDGEIVFGPDPELTALGIDQAKENNQAWRTEIESGCPIPDKFYVSPMQRSCQTLEYTWDGIKPADQKVKVFELLRERLGLNLCDKRSPLEVIKQRFPHFDVDGVPEQDELYQDDYREKLHEQSFRVMKFLDYLFEQDVESGKVDRAKAQSSRLISTTSHAGVIRAFILGLGHRNFTICTGGMIPILIKGTRKD